MNSPKFMVSIGYQTHDLAYLGCLMKVYLNNILDVSANGANITLSARLKAN